MSDWLTSYDGLYYSLSLFFYFLREISWVWFYRLFVFEKGRVWRVDDRL